MKQTFDTDEILFGILKGSLAIMSTITGGVYVRQRPLNSKKEDIVVNTIDLTQQNAPQIGTSNINVHVSDKVVNIASEQQTMIDNDRLKAISGLVLAAIREAKVPGLALYPTGQFIIQEADIKQHYVNIRINWSIHE